MVSASSSSLIGRELSHYRIVEKIGGGGMGEVFLAHDEHLGHNVALKILPDGIDDHSRRLFRKEAHALSKLNHPNIVTVLDFDTQEGIDFLVMEYVSGLALDERVREGALPEKEAIRIGVQLAEALTAAHQQGVVHRDLKPGNLRLTDDERLKILDFGLARSTLSFSPQASTASLEGPNECSGTLPYMATEQLLGRVADARTDIYSVGAVLYELCTGTPPFEQTLFTGMVDAILHKPPIPPSHRRPGISTRLEAVILKCLEKDPDKRYQSAAELAQTLRELSTPHHTKSSSRSRLVHRSAAILMLVLLILVAWHLGHRRRADTTYTPPIQSLAVLPFANLSADPQQEYLADGVTDFLITELGQLQAVQRIISRTSVLHYKTEHQPLREIARHLNVDAIVEGAVVRSENTVHVTVRLVSAADDRQLWSHSYENELRDLLVLEHELALGIAREIRSNLPQEDRAQLARARRIEPAVQEAYLKGKYLQFGTAEQRTRAREYFQEALQLDPSYAPTYTGLADSYWNDISLPAQDSMTKAREYALKAVSLDDTLAQAHTSLATVRFYGDWDWSAADREYQRALQLNPNDAEAHRMYSVYLAAMGRAHEALAQVLVAQELDPLYPGSSSTAGWNLYCARRYDEALEYCRKAVELAPNDDGSHGCMGYSYFGKGQYREALAESKRALSLSEQEPVWMVLIGRTYAQKGERRETRMLLDRLLSRSRKTYVPPVFIAVLYASIGDSERSFLWLDRAYTQRDLYLAGLKVDPAFDPLRSDPRFQALSRRMGF
ncbi:MAG TPA: protein kinase [Dongiaceae bacterium]|nr:protein kinase [Dongiaceae bacterium]